MLLAVPADNRTAYRCKLIAGILFYRNHEYDRNYVARERVTQPVSEIGRNDIIARL